MGARSKVIAATAITAPQATLPSEPTTQPSDRARDDELAAYCPDLDQWPRSWMYEDRDLSPGRLMVECFKPFLRELLSMGRSRRTLRRHRDNLWLLGGEIIRDLHETPSLRRQPIAQVMIAAIADCEGPLIRGASEAVQGSFDATCCTFYRFLTEAIPTADRP